jgi:hypothetical protein
MSGYFHALIDTIRPDWPADSRIRVIAHRGDVRFIELTSMSGNTEGWSVQLDAEQARALGESLRLAAENMR